MRANQIEAGITDTGPQAVAAKAQLDDVIHAGIAVLKRTQQPDGSWIGDYGGPMFLLPTYVIAMRVLERDIPAQQKREMVRYLKHHQNADGSWGLHYGGPGLVYTTAIAYVALRLLGEQPDRQHTKRGRTWLLDQGGAVNSAPWGKVILAVLGAYDYAGVLPTLPELWLLPRALPLHPTRFWCHARMVYLPMSYLYATRAKLAEQPDILKIRDELYVEPYRDIDWHAHRYSIAASDNFRAMTTVYMAMNEVLTAYEKRADNPASKWLRKSAVATVLDHIRYEDETTNYICLGPVNKLLNLLTWHFANPGGPEIERHLAQLPEYLWQADEGLNMNGYNSSKLWDTAFAVHAVDACDAHDKVPELLDAANDFIRDNQIDCDPPQRHRYHRDWTKGAWPFSDAAQGWPTSDCTAEGIKAALALQPHVRRPVQDDDLRQAVRYILHLQNRDGGWPTYEQARGSVKLEALNPAAAFADIIVDYSYPECTSASMSALVEMRPRCDRTTKRRIDKAIAVGRRYLNATQRQDGSWYGSWGICFTYGTWFGISGLIRTGSSRQDPEIRRAVQFLKDHQLSDGGWGETMRSCRSMVYDSTEQGQAVMTAWALLALIEAGEAHTKAVEQAVRFLLDRQQVDGTWPPEVIAGVFNKTCAIHYDNYLNVFPLWALGNYRKARMY